MHEAPCDPSETEPTAAVVLRVALGRPNGGDCRTEAARDQVLLGAFKEPRSLKHSRKSSRSFMAPVGPVPFGLITGVFVSQPSRAGAYAVESWHSKIHVLSQVLACSQQCAGPEALDDRC